MINGGIGDAREVINFAKTVVLEAGELAYKLRWDSELVVTSKQDGTKVTNADLEVEQFITSAILAEYPEHRVHGEEFGSSIAESNSDYLWTVDAIDGTHAYLNHENNCVVNVALLKGSATILSVIYNPFTKELFSTSCGGHAELNGKPLPIVRRKQLRDGTLNYQVSRENLDDICSLVSLWTEKRVAKIIEAGGSPAYNLACVAKGSHDHFVMYCSRAAKPEDYAGPVSLVRNAGGLVTGLDGKDIDSMTHRGYFVASGEAEGHDELLELLNGLEFGTKKIRPRVIFAAGFYGTGKSSFAKVLAEKLEYRSFSADETRRELRMESYRPSDSDVVWGLLFWQAARELDQGRNVIIESLFLNDEQRKPDFDLAKSKDADGMFVEVICPEKIAKSRISKREVTHDGIHVPTNRVEHYDLKKDQWEPVIPTLRPADRRYISYLIFDSHANKLYSAHLRDRHRQWADEIALALGVTLIPAPRHLIEAKKRYDYISA